MKQRWRRAGRVGVGGGGGGGGGLVMSAFPSAQILSMNEVSKEMIASKMFL